MESIWSKIGDAYVRVRDGEVQERRVLVRLLACIDALPVRNLRGARTHIFACYVDSHA